MHRALVAEDDVTIRPFAPDDAASLTACFRRCYGDSYVAGFFYDPEAIRARARDGRLQSMVAVTDTGEIVGHMALTRRHPDALTMEAGNTVVDPRFRGHGLAGRLGAALFGACRDAGAIGFHHYPTTAHAIMQKLAVQGGGIETGIMLGYVPAGTDYRDLGGASEAGRLAVVVVYQPLAPAPARELCPPPRYASLLATLWARAGLSRTVRTPGATFVASATRLRSTLDAARGLLHVDVERGGADAGARVREAAAGADAVVIHVDLPLADPATPGMVETLRADGFFFCALLPEFAASDVLRLQRFADPTEPCVRPELVHAEARAILDAAPADRAEAGSAARA